MNVTLEYLADHLPIEPVSLTRRKGAPLQTPWLQVIQHDPEAELEPQFILFGDGASFGRAVQGRGIVAIGKPQELVCRNNDVLLLPEQCDPDFVLREMQRSILGLNLWEADLVNILRQNAETTQQGTLDALFTRAADLLQNSIFFHDENFYLLGNTEHGGTLGLTHWEFDDMRGGYTLPIDILNEFKVNDEYQRTMNTHGPHMFSADMFGYRIMYQNIWDEDRYRGRICVNELDREFRDSDFLLLERLASLVQDAFRQREAGAYRQMRSMANLLSQLIDQNPVPEAQVSETLAQYGWKLDDRLFCACLFPEERDVNTHTLQYYSTMLTGRFPHSCAFSHGSSIIVVVNQERSDIGIAEFRSDISLILRDGLLKAGISNVIPGITDVFFAYRQAICAYETGKDKQPELWCFSFEDVCADYLVSQMVKELPARHLCSPDLFALMAYDENHTSELCKTLRIYLQNDRNLARTAEILGIHRSTLLFRMRKIGEIVKADLNDYEARFYLQLSLRLIDGHNTRQSSQPASST